MSVSSSGLCAIGLVMLAAVVGCSGPPAGVIRFSEANASASDSSDDEDEDDDTSTKAKTDTSSEPLAETAGSRVFADEVYSSLASTCAACHQAGVGGAPVFFGSDAAATYELFKAKSFELPESVLVRKGKHTGPALTEAQETAIETWVTAEGG